MEHVASIINRNIPHLVPSERSPFALPDLIEQLEEREAQELPDAVVALCDLRMDTTGELLIPDRGGFTLNDWSRQQLSVRLGLRWERWFAGARPVDVAEEVNRRLARATDRVRLRLRDVQDRRELRALVTPGYTAVRDSVVARALMQALGRVEQRFRVLRFAVTEMTTTFVVAMGEPYRVGGSGRVGDVWGSILVRNSGTGYASLAAQIYCVRLVCLNGLTAPLSDATIIRRAHRGLDEAKLGGLLGERLGNLPERLRAASDVMAAADDVMVTDVRDEVARILSRARLPSRLLPAVFEAFRREPHQSAFGVSQALTLAAQSLAPEERHDMEAAAGRYLAERTGGHIDT